MVYFTLAITIQLRIRRLAQIRADRDIPQLQTQNISQDTTWTFQT